MIFVAAVKVQSFSLDFLDVTWELVDTSEDVTGYTFTVQRSESPAGPFDDVASGLVDLYTHRDRRADLYTRWRTYYYRVQVKKPVTGETSLSPVSFLGAEPDRVALEMARLQQLVLKVHIGTPVLVYKRRTSGQACPQCYDPVRGRTTDSDCEFCFNSRYRGGFLSPVPTFVNFTPGNKVIQLAGPIEQEPSEKTTDMTGYPLMNPGDLIVDPQNRRWRVSNIQERSKQGFVFRQILRLTEISRTEVVYKLKIDSTLFPTREGELWPLPWDTGKIVQVPEAVIGR